MNATRSTRPETLGLFEQRFAGDESLVRLARRRFQEAQMGVEVHAATGAQLDWFLSARPWSGAPMVVHLPRDFDLLQETVRSQIVELASRCPPSVLGMVVHDQQAMVERKNDYLEAVRKLDRDLESRSGARVFIEYAAGLEPVQFIEFFTRIRDLDQVSACIDIGHVGIRATRVAYAKTHPGQDACALKSQGPDLPSLMPELQSAVQSGRDAVLNLIDNLATLNKPLHFHLHDGHPLSTFSPFGVADHLSFFAEIPLKFNYDGRVSIPTMFGPAGLELVVRQAMKSLAPGKLSFTLEIHPTGESLPLGDAAELFAHWTIKTNAERTNHWLAVLNQNHALLLKSIEASLPTSMV